jgi:hypothetical protein
VGNSEGWDRIGGERRLHVTCKDVIPRLREDETEASIRVFRMFKSHI